MSEPAVILEGRGDQDLLLGGQGGDSSNAVAPTNPAPATFDENSLEAVLAKLGDAEVAEAAMTKTPPTNALLTGEKLEGPPSPGLDAGEGEDGEEAVCAVHGKKRKAHYLALQEDGTYTCVAPNLCKMPRPGHSGAVNNGMKSSPETATFNNGPGRASPLAGVNQLCSPGDQSVMCRVHGKYRSARNMIKLENGEFHCHPNFQCRIERGPGRKSPAGAPVGHPGLAPSGSSGILHPPAPGLARNSSSVASLASNISIGADGSISFGNQPAGVTPPMQTLFAPPQVTQAGATQYVVLPPGGAPPPVLAPSGSSSSLLQAPVTYVQQPGGAPIALAQQPVPHPGLPANASAGQFQMAPPVQQLTPSNSGQQLQQFQIGPNGQPVPVPTVGAPLPPQPQVTIVGGPPPQQQTLSPQFLSNGVIQQPPGTQIQFAPPPPTQQPPQMQYVQYAAPPAAPMTAPPQQQQLPPPQPQT